MPRITWHEMLERMVNRFGVEVHPYFNGGLELRRYRGGHSHEFLYAPMPKYLDNPVTPGVLEEICIALDIDIDKLAGGD